MFGVDVYNETEWSELEALNSVWGSLEAGVILERSVSWVQVVVVEMV